jgi:hypothetical protein
MLKYAVSSLKIRLRFVFVSKVVVMPSWSLLTSKAQSVMRAAMSQNKSVDNNSQSHKLTLDTCVNTSLAQVGASSATQGMQ